MIKHIEIRNFRSIREVAVDLEPLTVLIGRSGAGKSNFVQAIRLLRNILAHRNYHQVRELVLTQNVMPAWGEPGNLGYRVTIDIPRFTHELEYSVIFGTKAGPQLGSTIEERLVAGNDVVFHHKNEDWVFRPAVQPLPPPGQLILGSLT